MEAGLVTGLPVRLLAADRPGYGNSDPDHRPSLRGRAEDLRHLLDALGIDRLPVIGVSGGGPLAAAFAMAHPERVAALALVSAVPPQAAACGDGLALLLRVGRHPRRYTPLLHFARVVVRTQHWGERAVFSGDLPPSDAAVLTPKLRTGLVDAMREGLRRGIAGARADAMLYASDWGFDPSSLSVPVSVWHGTVDHLIPVACADAFAGIAGVQRHLLAGDGHYAPALGHAATIIEELLRRAANP